MAYSDAAEEGRKIKAAKELTAAETEQQHKDLLLEKQRLEIETMKLALAEARSKQENKRVTRENAENELKAGRDSQKRRENSCNHKSGGKNMEGLNHGADAYYATVIHTYPDNKAVVHCFRCQKEWRPGDPGYPEALQWPSRNEPSTGVTFNIPARA